MPRARMQGKSVRWVDDDETVDSLSHRSSLTLSLTKQLYRATDSTYRSYVRVARI